MIQNPILPGFYPDPSICRAGDDYYIVNSSFSYSPGVPVFHSRDLVNWEQVGYALDRKEQLPLTYEMISGGIFAPTIRYHQGIFYMITTNMSMGCVNFVVTAEHPAGPWSDMHIIQGADGIDPSLFFDEDGTCYYTGTTRFEDESGDRQGIWCSKLDIKEFKLTGERHIIGTGAQCDASSPEGPHIYKKDGYYYLMIAEGGTEHYHAITISRSKDIFGPYENHQGNPILTHRHLGRSYPICNAGHGDMIELPDGSWYMVLLASRLMNGYHKILGRETFLAPVAWEDGWPVVSPGTGKVEETYPAPNLPEQKLAGEGMTVLADMVTDDFDKDTLGYVWNFLGTPYQNFYRIENSCLRLKLLKNSIVPWEFDNTNGDVFQRISRIGKTKECVSFIGRRQQHLYFTVTAAMKFIPEKNETAGITILQNDANQLRIESANDGGQSVMRCISTKVEYDELGMQHFKETILGSIPFEAEQDFGYIRVTGNGTGYSFYAGSTQNKFLPVAQDVDGSFLGSETAGGFVGAYIGMFASGNGKETDKYASFDYFLYEGRKDKANGKI